jgi:hypothetical protein
MAKHDCVALRVPSGEIKLKKRKEIADIKAVIDDATKAGVRLAGGKVVP